MINAVGVHFPTAREATRRRSRAYGSPLTVFRKVCTTPSWSIWAKFFIAPEYLHRHWFTNVLQSEFHRHHRGEEAWWWEGTL